MIISRTPYRISLFGGGTDYPQWLNKNKGHVISTSIDKYAYLSCRYLPPFFSHRLRIVYSKQELVKKTDQILHPSVRAVLKYLNINKHLEIHYDGDLPARSGIGSSSTFTVGLLNALSKYNKINLSKKSLANKTIYIEQKIIKESVGSQDQISASYGGFNYIKFIKDKFEVQKINLKNTTINNLDNNLLLFHTGIFRTAETVSKKYINKFNDKKNHLFEIYNLVKEAKNNLKSGDIDSIGYLLNETWHLKREISKFISNKYIDEIYSTGIANGAYGGKLLGAGGGGFILFYAPKKNQKKLIKSLSKLLHVPFNFENDGSKIIYTDKQKRYPNHE